MVLGKTRHFKDFEKENFEDDLLGIIRPVTATDFTYSFSLRVCMVKAAFLALASRSSVGAVSQGNFGSYTDLFSDGVCKGPLSIM